MAFSTVTIPISELLTSNPEAEVSVVASALSANAAMAALGGAQALARGVAGFLLAYRAANEQALSVLSAGRAVTVAASVTSSLLTLTVQVKAVV
mgnify:CR=1 FL=1